MNLTLILAAQIITDFQERTQPLKKKKLLILLIGKFVFMCTIDLKDILASASDLPKAGDIFYEKLVDANAKSQKITVNMDGVSSLPSIFLNVSIGRLIDSLGIQWIKDNLTFTRITKAQALRLSDYLSRYRTVE